MFQSVQGYPIFSLGIRVKLETSLKIIVPVGILHYIVILRGEVLPTYPDVIQNHNHIVYNNREPKINNNIRDDINRRSLLINSYF